MEKLNAIQKKRLWLRILTPNCTWASHVDWAKRNLGVEITEEEMSTYYVQRLTGELAPI